MNIERGYRRLTVVISVVILTLGIGADYLLPTPHWKVTATVRGLGTAVLRLTWISSSAHDREAVARKLSRVMRCATGASDRETDCSSYDREVSVLPDARGGDRRMAKSWVRYDGGMFSVTHPSGASRDEIISLAKEQYPKTELAALARDFPPPPDAKKPATRERFVIERTDSFVPEAPPPGFVQVITARDITEMHVVREWSVSDVQFTLVAFALIALLWIAFFSVRWVARGFASDAR